MSTTAPICESCNINECTYDFEDGYSSTCPECFRIRANAPWCHHHECAGRIGGGRTRFTGQFNADGEALYLCEGQHFGSMTHVQHAAHSGVTAGEYDARKALTDNDSLVHARLRHIGALVATENAASRAYSQAYVAAALATLAGTTR